MDLDKITKELKELSDKVRYKYEGSNLMREFLSQFGIKFENSSSRSLGRCYWGYYVDVVSDEQLPDELINIMRDTGVFPGGQEFESTDPVLNKDGKFVVHVTVRCDSSD